MIRDTYCHIRTIDQTIPDDVLDFMKDAAIEKLRKHAVIGSFSLPQIWKMADKYNCDDFVKMVEEINRLNDL